MMMFEIGKKYYIRTAIMNMKCEILGFPSPGYMSVRTTGLVELNPTRSWPSVFSEWTIQVQRIEYFAPLTDRQYND